MRTNAKRPGHRGDGRAAQNDQIVEPIADEDSREAVIRQAAAWYADHRYDAERPLVPNLSRRFGLTTREAVRALSIVGKAA
jgi:hypothetical protein